MLWVMRYYDYTLSAPPISPFPTIYGGPHPSFPRDPMAPPQLRSLARDALDTAETIWLALLMPNRPVAIKTSSPRRYFRLYRKMRFFRYISSNKIYHTPKFSHLVIALIPTDSFAVEFGGVVVVGHEIL